MAGKRVKVRSGTWLGRLLFSAFGKALLALTALLLLAAGVIFTYYYVRYAKLIDQKLTAGPFARTSKIYAAPRVISVGEVLAAPELVTMLRRAGYGESRNNRTGWYHVRNDAVEIFPGPEALQQEAAVVKLQDHRVAEIVSAQDNTRRTQYLLEPELITNLSDRKREKRRLVSFEDIPPVLVQAVISAEDKRFFQHAGFDPLRIAKAAYVDLREGYKKEGASTLSMQLARGFWLNTSKSWRRKAAEVLITLQLEQRLTKKEIFEYYANNVDLGRRGSFAIAGFGQAAQAYFNKDIRQLDLPESAMLAGLIQLPSYYNPFRHPERMKERRNVILSLMRQNGYITDREYALAIQAPLKLAPGAVESSEAPYFVDLVNNELESRFQGRDFRADAYRVYTTLDPELQHAAVEAVQIGIQNVDAQLRKQRRFKGTTPPEAQVALIAMDPHTGEVRALVGGRNYGTSQLNRALAKRQPGSAFKPFVYTAALNTAIEEGGPEVFTPSTRVLDEPTTFWFDDKPYEPGNFGNHYFGEVTLRQAMAKSLNIPTVKIAEKVGYTKISELARQAGMNYDIQPTPAIALGAYEVTPIEVAGAYTIFTNSGLWVKPHWISLVKASNNQVLFAHKPETRAVLDPRVAYMMVNMLEEVTRSGTAAGIRSRGIGVPAAGKTGSSHDGWFAGFTSELICVVWVGLDDNQDLRLEGAKSALPIWAEFMKRALQLKEYRDAKPFEAPEGITTMEIDPLSGEPATANCPSTRVEVYIAGTEPVARRCFLHGGGHTSATHVAGWDQPVPTPPTEPATSSGAERGELLARQADPPPAPPAAPPLPAEKNKEKKGFLRRLLSVFK